MKIRRLRIPARHQAFSLVEVVLALGLCSFVLVTLLGLVSAGLRQDRDSRDVMGAMLAANRILDGYRAVAASTNSVPNFPLPTDLTASASNDPASPLYLDDKGAKVTGPAKASFAVLYKLLPSPQASVACSQVYLYFFWPPGAPVASARGHYEVGTTIALTATSSSSN